MVCFRMRTVTVSSSLLLLLLLSTMMVDSTDGTGTTGTGTPRPTLRSNLVVSTAPREMQKHRHLYKLQSCEDSEECAVEKESMLESGIHLHDDSSSNAPISVRGGSSEFTNALLDRLRIGSYFALWYALNIVYNILNKKLLNVLPAPLTVGSFQFGIGSLYCATLWILRLRPVPTLNAKGKNLSIQVGFHHMAGQLFSMVSLGAGSVSFTHIVKALEPFFSAIVSALVFGKWMKPQVYATLIPVVGGVGYACLKERSFSWLAFSTAMSSNLSFALRAVMSKQAMTKYVGENITSANLFGIVTWIAFAMSIPVAILLEGTSIVSLWKKATETTDTVALLRSLVISGLFHYLNNEVMYLALSNVHPVTLAVGNTMKRVFIMVASVLVFRNPVSVQAGIGSAIGISGVLFYSLVKQYYEKMEANATAIGSKKKAKAGTKIVAKTASRARPMNSRK